MARAAKFYLNADRLRANGACEAQVKKFIKVFGNGNIEVNDRNFRRAVRAGLQIWWVAIMYLPRTQYEYADRSYFELPYEAQCERYWTAIKAHMAADDAKRPQAWY